jgi:hypothetical protein
MIKDKKLSVCNQIKKIDLEKREITFKLSSRWDSYNNDVDKLLAALLEQKVNFFSKIPIRGLELMWTEYSGDDLKF